MAVPVGSLAVSYCRVDSLSANVQMFRERFLFERPSPCRGAVSPRAQSPAQHPAPITVSGCSALLSHLTPPRLLSRLCFTKMHLMLIAIEYKSACHGYWYQ